MITLILGGARSGKSSRALKLARGRRTIYFVATARRVDAEMRRRIAAHRRQRPANWRTIEESIRVPERLARIPRGSTVIIDCVTLWIGALLSGGREKTGAIGRRVDDLLAAIRARKLNVIVVSNEVGSGVVPPTRLGRAFENALGATNTRLATEAKRVELMVAGIPLKIKG